MVSLQSLSADSIRTFLPADFAGEIIVKDVTASTNEDAKKLALQNAAAGVVVISDGQTAGRGRGSKSFYSPKGTGLYLTILISANAHTLMKITPFAGVCVCKTIEAFSAQCPKLKWVNDVFIRGKKVCGILCETIPQTSLVAVGIGINLYPAEFPAELRDSAGWVFSDVSIERNRFAAELIKNLTDAALFKNCIEEYRRRSCVVGKQICYFESGIRHEAEAVGIDDFGGLIIREQNLKKTLVAGEITLRVL